MSVKLLNEFALGFWRLDDAKLSQNALESLVLSALDHNVTVMDHADIYGEYRCEAIFGQLLKAKPSLRDKMTIVSKCGIKLHCAATPNVVTKHYDLSAKSIKTSVENTLKNLNIDVLDVLLVHRPSPIMDVNEIADSFAELKHAGKVKAFGVSNFTSSQFDLLNSRIELITNQIEYSLLHTSPMYDGTLDQLQQYRLRPMAWSPLAGGALFSPKLETQKKMVQKLQSLLPKYNADSIDQIALAWILKHPAKVMPVLGTQNQKRFENALKAKDIKLSLEDWFAILEIANGCEVP
ncbi:aldo/keto reductase [Cysteiniphilum halobium]|uniref:aldo/keto reductase n=1 Tax=Cysteiniphilum halobium TaxID=2219059 RepID=UPI003F8775E2